MQVCASAGCWVHRGLGPARDLRWRRLALASGRARPRISLCRRLGVLDGCAWVLAQAMGVRPQAQGQRHLTAAFRRPPSSYGKTGSEARVSAANFPQKDNPEGCDRRLFGGGLSPERAVRRRRDHELLPSRASTRLQGRREIEKDRCGRARQVLAGAREKPGQIQAGDLLVGQCPLVKRSSGVKAKWCWSRWSDSPAARAMRSPAATSPGWTLPRYRTAARARLDRAIRARLRQALTRSPRHRVRATRALRHGRAGASEEDARAWARHFGMDRDRNQVVLIGDRDSSARNQEAHPGVPPDRPDPASSNDPRHDRLHESQKLASLVKDGR